MHLLWQFSRYEWRTGQLKLLCFALILAITSLTTVNFLIERVDLVLKNQAQILLAADLVLNSDTPIDSALEKKASDLKIRFAKTTTTMSMLFVNDQTQLVELKAVSQNYPLYGALIKDTWQSNQDNPELFCWLDPKLVSKLKITPRTPLNLGEVAFYGSGMILDESGQTLDFSRIAPRLILSEPLLKKSQLIQLGSRVKYRFYFASEDKHALFQLKQFLQKQLKRGQIIEEANDVRPEIREVLDRVKQFLNLVSLLSVFFAFIASLISLQHYVRENIHQIAVLKCLGLTRPQLLKLYAQILFFVAVGTALIGIICGFLLQTFAPFIFPEVFEQTNLTWKSIYLISLEHILLNLVLVFGLAIPFLFQLVNIPVLVLLRASQLSNKKWHQLIYLIGLICIAFLFLYKTHFEVLGMMSLVIFTLLFVLMVGLIALIVSAFYTARKFFPARFYFPLAFLKRRIWTYGIQGASLTLGLGCLLILTLVRQDLITNWQAQLPHDAPNRFLINIQTHQVEDLRAFFQKKKGSSPHFFPMIKGRLIAINNQPIQLEKYTDKRTIRLLTREFNLSYAQNVLINQTSKIVEGHVWEASAEPFISIEKDLAARFHLKVGDTLSYMIAGDTVTAKILNIRTVKWNSLDVNFFVIFNETALKNYPKSWVTSFYLSPENISFEKELVAAFPNLTIIDTTHLIKQLQAFIEKIIFLVQGVFVFVLIAGILILYTVVISLKFAQKTEVKIQRYLGATTKRLLQDKLLEILLLGSLVGAIAALFASGIEWLLSLYIFDINFHFNIALLIIGIISGLSCYFLAFRRK